MSAPTSFPKEKIKILLLEGVHKDSIKVLEAADYSNIEWLPHALSEEDLLEKIKDAHFVGIRSKTQMTRKIIENAPKLMGIACFCIGTNQVDLQAATEMGVAVFNSPYSNTRSVAELVIAECVMLMRRIPERSHQAHKGIWLKDATRSYELRGKTLGIVGYGHIGSQVSVLAEALGMKVQYFDVIPKLPLGNADAVDSLDQLIKTSDVLTLHVPADESTKYMIKKAQLEMMPKGSYLINLSRGNVVELESLRDLLKSGHIAGAAVDVFPLEPKSKDEKFSSPLQDLRNVILTPHIGGSTQEAQQNIAKDAAFKIVSYLDKGTTVGSHTVPELSLTSNAGNATHRILHIHRNVPGVLSEVNSTLSGLNVNIVGQFLKTNPEIGYVVLDVEKSASEEALSGLLDVGHTIRARILY